jgi:hypothetical protein
MAVIKADTLSQKYKINRGEGNLRKAILYMLNTVIAVFCVL